jgi:hypothetical protein
MEKEKTREIIYIVNHPVQDDQGYGFIVSYDKEEREGYYHGVVRDVKNVEGYREPLTYDYGLIEDREEGKLVKVELSDIQFKNHKTQPYGVL